MTEQPATLLGNRILIGMVGVLLLVGTHSLLAISEARVLKRVDKMLSFIPDVAASYSPDGEIKGTELREMLEPQLFRMVLAGQKVKTSQVHEWAETLLDSLLRHRLLLEAATVAGYHPEEPLGRKRVEEMKAKIGEQAYRRTLEAQGATESEMAQHFAELGAIDEWISAVIVPKCQSTENDLRATYAENVSRYRTPELLSASHILIRINPDSSRRERSKAKQKAEEILQEIRTEGIPFSDLARMHSDCPSSRHGGDLGFFQQGRMVQAFEEALLKLQCGEISGIVETRYGFHIIQRGITIPSRQQSFREVAADIAEKRTESSIEDLLRSTGNRLKQDRNVRIFLGEK